MTPTTHSQAAERQAFEAWCRVNHQGASLDRRPSDNNEYDCVLSAWTWGAWKARAELARQQEVVIAEPVDMVLHCPRCHLQHVDMTEYVLTNRGPNSPPGNQKVWDNPPHKSHLCHGCGHIWRPADVPTNGVRATKTAGKNDTAPPSTAHTPEQVASVAPVVSVVSVAEPQGLYVHARECEKCGHVGINDDSGTQSACLSCDWSGPSPEKDKCPGCRAEGCMSCACPKCGGAYKLLTEATLPTHPPTHPSVGAVGADEDFAHIQSIFRTNSVHYAGNYEVTPGQALRIAAILASRGGDQGEVGL